MTRKTPVTSIEGQVQTYANALTKIEPPGPLCDLGQVVWDEIMGARAKDEWHGIQPRIAYELTLTLVDLARERRTLAEEPSMFHVKGKPVVNPRIDLVEKLMRRVVLLQRQLRIHPAAEGTEPGLVVPKRNAEREAVAMVAAIQSGQDDFDRLLAMQ